MGVEQRYLSRIEAARYLGISARSLDRLVACKKLPAFRLQRRVLLDRADVDEFCRGLKASA